MKLLKNAGHKTPVSAWIPIWSTNSLLEIGGIKQPWIWTLLIIVGSSIGNMIPVLGVFIAIAAMVIAVILTIYMAKGVQAGVGTGSTGGIVLAVLVPIAWIIWMAIASGKTAYNKEAAIAQGSTMPMNWFGESDLYAPFGVVNYPQHNAPQNPYGGTQSQQYAPPQAPANAQQYTNPQYTPLPDLPEVQEEKITNDTEPKSDFATESIVQPKNVENLDESESLDESTQVDISTNEDNPKNNEDNR